MRLEYLLIAILLPAGLWCRPANAKCLDPRGCLTDICSYPGNVVELTVLATPTQDGFILVRVDAVQTIDAEKFEQPTVGEELEISVWSMQQYSVGQRLVGLAREPGNVAWPLFGLGEDGDVSCLAPRVASKSLTMAEFVAVAQSGRCDRSPMPKLVDCDDQDSGCASASFDSLWIFSPFLVFLLRSSPRRLLRRG
jgi:hypothetical protein